MGGSIESWSYHALKDEDYRQQNELLEKKDALDVLKWAYETFDDELLYACSFGAEGIVLIDLISKVKPDAHIAFLDTHLHFTETYSLINEIREKYPRLTIEMVEPELSLQEQADQYGEALWGKNPDRCCGIRKKQPLERGISKYQAWLSGLRREQSPTRANINYINRDDTFKSIKVCPLIHWTWDDVWQYIETFDLPYNPLHDQGYPSIGCTKCTQPVKEGEDLRAGRWSGSGKTECGLHLNS
ncbi:phosphoadenylyl-sulfate reductase [Texcoconibacillus texcoconensis]|uniref:Adenosine 5'-phosphosulfate reductase n=1 Tax=Texcoconibacillus texcoconensis TaxID=1095777 RepID=A0A840QLU1_9BACI|nr:phosphoadenylyl-sulfate reductase [Texcoconibacillus texcoconensis]MBB5172342.1 phosphoadenosine phosphosulfate reductase [Texcoconibacillus texcoconensis]